MAIGSFEINAMMGRTQDYSILKHHEDNKTNVDQSVFQNQSDKQVESKSQTVQSSAQSETNQQQKDAREKGDNEYAGDGGKNRNAARANAGIAGDGKVIKKGNAVPRFECKV